MIPLMKTAFLNEFQTRQALSEFIMKTPKFSMDEQCRKFEHAFALFQLRKDAILFNSGGSANLSLIQALMNLGKLKKDDTVGFSALTWSTNVMPIIQMGLEPVPLDIDPLTLNVMSDTLEKCFRKTHLKALFITNALGFTGDLNNIRGFCIKNNILLLEDNCESLGTELKEGKAGNFGIASTFSFFIAHHMSTIEGGMVCTDDKELAEMLRIVRANGWDRNLNSSQQIKWRHRYNVKNEFQAKYTFYDLGYNFRPTEITGFLGLFQLKFLAENISTREKYFIMLDDFVRKNPELVAVERDHISKISCFAFPVLCRTADLRNKYFQEFSGAGVEIRPMIAGNMQNQPFYRKYISKNYELPGTITVDHTGFYFGLYPDLTESDLEILKSCLSTI